MTKFVNLSPEPRNIAAAFVVPLVIRGVGKAKAQIPPDIGAQVAQELRLLGACGTDMALEGSALGKLGLDQAYTLCGVARLREKLCSPSNSFARICAASGLEPASVSSRARSDSVNRIEKGGGSLPFAQDCRESCVMGTDPSNQSLAP